jgi:hypothetical protein
MSTVRAGVPFDGLGHFVQEAKGASGPRYLPLL